MSDRERIGAAIASLRAKRGMTVRQLADITGIGFSNISKIEKGRFSTGIDTLSKIAYALGAKIVLMEDDKC